MRSPVFAISAALLALVLVCCLVVVSLVPARLLLTGRLWASAEEQAARRALPGFVHAPNSAEFMGRFTVPAATVDIMRIDPSSMREIVAQVAPVGNIRREGTGDVVFFRRHVGEGHNGVLHHVAWVSAGDGGVALSLSWQTPDTATEDQLESVWAEVRARVLAFVEALR